MLCSSYNQKKETTNLKAKNQQNCQKIELYISPTTKELKKKQTSRLVEGVEKGWRECLARQQLVDQVGEVAAGGRDGPTFECG